MTERVKGNSPIKGLRCVRVLLGGKRCGEREELDRLGRPDDDTPEPRPETEAELLARLAWEAKGIAEARAQLDAGLTVDAAEVDAWIDAIRRWLTQPGSGPRARRRLAAIRAAINQLHGFSECGVNAATIFLSYPS